MIIKYLLIHYYIMRMLIMTILLGYKYFLHWAWLKYCFYHSTKIKWSFKIDAKLYIALNTCFSVTFIKWLVCIYIEAQLWINCMCSRFFNNLFYFWTQINYTWFKKRIQGEWNFMCCFFWYYMQFQFA
jgi:hypothetical protein